MKQILMGITLMPFLALATALNDGLVAWYRFDGNTDDASGHDNNLSALQNVSYCADHRGIGMSALQMSTNRLTCIGEYKPGSDWYNAKHIFTNAWTFACWFKTDKSTDVQEERTYGIYGYNDEIQYLYFPGGGSAIAVGNNGINVFEHHPSYMPATLRYDGDLAGWHHLAITIDSRENGFKLYVDGGLVKQGLQTGRDKTIDVLGGLNGEKNDGVGLGGGYYGSAFDGEVDNLYIYNRPLSGEEIKALYDGYSWDYVVKDGEASVIGVTSSDPIVPISGAVIIPSVLGGCPVTSVRSGAISMRDAITAVTIPASVMAIGESAFAGCRSLADVYFEGDALASVGVDAFKGCCWDLIMHVPADWQGRGRTLCGYSVWKAGSSDEEKSVCVTATNVVVQYVLNSVRPEIAVPVSGDTGFVAVITEVKSSGAVSVPIEWKANYPQFETKFGTDFGKALMMKSGKKDGAGNDMFVWQDYVAGTDPTDVNSRFTASITMIGDQPRISYTPELTEEQKSLRTYTIKGKKSLTDAKDWETVAEGREVDYNFFKVVVEMK